MTQPSDSPDPSGDASQPSSAIPPAQTAGASSAQLRFFQILSLLLLVAIVAGGGDLWYRQRHFQPITILINGRPTVTVANYAVALNVIHQAELNGIGAAYNAQGNPRATESIAYQHVGETATLNTEADAVAQLSRRLHVTVDAAVITINNKRAVALPDQTAAQATLDSIQQHYVNMQPNDPLYGKPSFQEKVDIEPERVPVSLCKATAAEAAALMLAPPKGKQYIVQSGDTGYRIARKFHITLSAFLQANAGRDVNRLAPGNIVNVAPTIPPITVVVQKQATRIEPIIPGATDGTGGERAVSDIYTYINGVRQPGSDPIGAVILKRATPRRYID